MAVIIAPNLEHFVLPEVRVFIRSDEPPTMFSGVEGKFGRVCDICVNPRREIDATYFCRAFPNVRHADFNTPATFFSSLTSDDHTIAHPVDNWKDMESLTLRETNEWLDGIGEPAENVYADPLIKWLRRQKELGQPSLRVKLAGDIIFRRYLHIFRDLYDVLHECCTLELGHIITYLGLLYLGKLVDGPLQSVSCLCKGLDVYMLIFVWLARS